MASETPEQGITISAGAQIARRLETLMGLYSGLSRHATGLVALQLGIDAMAADPAAAGPHLPPYARYIESRKEMLP
jgi:hypothetical protein